MGEELQESHGETCRHASFFSKGGFVYLLAHELQQKIKIQQHNGVWMENRRSVREHIENTVMSLYEGGSLEAREVHCLRP